MTTAADLRKHFMEEYAQDLLDLYGQAALGEGTFFKTINEARQGMFSTLQTMLQQAGDLQKLNAQSTKGVIDALSAGKITINDALKMMELLDKQANIEKVNDIHAYVEQMKATPMGAR